MCSWGLLLALTAAGKYKEALLAINSLGEKLEDYYKDEQVSGSISTLVGKMKESEHSFILGKGQNYYISLEGALKIKETTYRHAEGFAAGELKHGVIALIEKGTPVFVIVSNDEDREDMINAAAEVKARGAYVVGISKNDNELFDIFVKTEEAGLADPISNIMPFHLLAYHLAVELGFSPDKPRNLAKSVTVK